MKRFLFIFLLLAVPPIMVPLVADATAYTLSASQSSDPLNMLISGSGYSGSTVTLDYGDGQRSQQLVGCDDASGAETCGSIVEYHLYDSPGTYTATTYDAAGNTLTNTTFTVAPGPGWGSATIDAASLTSSSAQPTLTGTVAAGTTGLLVLIGTGIDYGESNVAILGTRPGEVSISGTTWTAHLTNATLVAGATYIVHIYDTNQYGGKNHFLASGKLVVSPNATCSNCTNIPFIISITPTSGPVGTQVTITGSNFIQGKTRFLGSMIWGNPSYSVSNGGAALTFIVPSTYTHPGPEYLCTEGAKCPPSYQPQTDPVSPGTYSISLDNDGNVGQSAYVSFTVTSGATTAPNPLPIPNSKVCPNVTRNLMRGVRGNDVVVLQNFLMSEGLLGNGNITGFFGVLTEHAVQAWQSTHGVVSGGSPSTTGYGFVGTRTRVALSHCD